jgi:glycosyltransferase involved in cell wall biosynthesis
MIIGIDGNEANTEKRVGIGEYAFELIREFGKLNKKNLTFRIYLKNNPMKDFPKARKGWEYRIIGPRKLWTQFRLPFELYIDRQRPDVFFSPSHYGPRLAPMPTAMSIMDLSYIHYPQLFNKKDLYQLVNWTKYSVKRASKIFTISLASKNDIIKTYKVPDDRVVVTYPGVKKALSMRKDKFNFDYILFVGTLQPRKNIVRLVEAFSKLTPKHPNLKLLIVGKKGWLYEDILKAPQKYNVESDVKFLDFVEDSKMQNLYKDALCFVLPSLYEGFGLPVLEAMKYGCPVVLSNVSSLPEAGGDAALYFDPQDADDMAKTMDKVISDPKLRGNMIKKGHGQVKKFSWEKTAKQTLSVLEDLANK